MAAVVRHPLRPQFQRRMRLPAPAATVLLTLVVLALGAGSAFAGPIAPSDSSGSPNAQGIRELYLIIFVLGAIIFFGVGGLLIYTLLKFRARKDAVALQIHGSTRMEVGWTIGAALLLVVLAIITFAKLGVINDPPNSSASGAPVFPTPVLAGDTDGAKQRIPPDGKSLQIDVNGQQYLWRYTYEDGDGNNLNNVYSYEEMVVPVNTTVTLRIRAQDVVHSWWIPALGGKFDAVPGYSNFTWFKATKLGTYTGQCAELCGRNHANMTARVTVVSPEDYERWYARQKLNIRFADKAQAASTRLRQRAARAVEARAGAEAAATE
jgi:cytochrome c oxidase subunit 2